MEGLLQEVMPLPDYRLLLRFQNESFAIVNLARRVRTIRFARLASSEMFVTARAAGDHVVWSDGKNTVSISCDELLDAMMMD